MKKKSIACWQFLKLRKDQLISHDLNTKQLAQQPGMYFLNALPFNAHLSPKTHDQFNCTVIRSTVVFEL